MRLKTVLIILTAIQVLLLSALIVMCVVISNSSEIDINPHAKFWAATQLGSVRTEINATRSELITTRTDIKLELRDLTSSIRELTQTIKNSLSDEDADRLRRVLRGLEAILQTYAPPSDD